MKYHDARAFEEISKMVMPLASLLGQSAYSEEVTLILKDLTGDLKQALRRFLDTAPAYDE